MERLRERRIRAHICAEVTLHIDKPNACALGDEHEGCRPGACKRTAQRALNLERCSATGKIGKANAIQSSDFGARS